jgi:hypothetical protein
MARHRPDLPAHRHSSNRVRGEGRSSATTVCSPFPEIPIRRRLSRTCAISRSQSSKGLRNFFKATDELEDKALNIIRWKEPKAAVGAIRDAAKNFKKNGK